MRSYFIFNNQNSSKYGILERLPPMQTPTSKNTVMQIPGKPEPVYQSEIELPSIIIPCVLGLTDKTKRRDVNAWLRGSGVLIFSDELDKFYKVANVTLGHEYLSTNFSKVGVNFECSPLAYSVGNEPDVLTTPGSIKINGTYFSEPIYTINFKTLTEIPENIVFMVNGQGVTIKLNEEHISHSVTLDATVQKIYYTDTKQLIMPDTSGLVPYLNTGGENIIDWSEDIIDSVEIVKNERWL